MSTDPTPGQNPPGSAPPELQPASRRIQALALALFLVALLAASLFLVPFGGLMVMGSDSCFSGDTALICSLTGQWLVALLPLSGCAGGLLVALLGGTRAIVRRHLLVLWLVSAAALPLITTLVALAIAEGNT